VTYRKKVFLFYALGLFAVVATWLWQVHGQRPGLFASLFLRSLLETPRPGWYAPEDFTAEQVKELEHIYREAAQRIDALFGDKQAQPQLILATTPSLFQRYGNSTHGAALTHMLPRGNAIIVLGPEALNVDVLAHELCHAELHFRLQENHGKIPVWFEEGLAMQVDARLDEQLSELEFRLRHGLPAPTKAQLADPDYFFSEHRFQNYLFAKLMVEQWYKEKGKEGFLNFLIQLEDNDFQNAFQ